MTGVLQYRAFSQHPAGGNELVVRHFNPRTEVSFCGHPVALRPRGLAGAAATG